VFGEKRFFRKNSELLLSDSIIYHKQMEWFGRQFRANLTSELHELHSFYYDLGNRESFEGKQIQD